MHIACQVSLLNANCNFNDKFQPGGEEPWNRGANMGHGLQRMIRSHRGKLPIVITKGNMRPLVPVIAAKFATECNIIVRNHIPVLRHWKEYKDDQRVLIESFLERLNVCTFSSPFPHLVAIRIVCLYACSLPLNGPDAAAARNLLVGAASSPFFRPN